MGVPETLLRLLVCTLPLTGAGEHDSSPRGYTAPPRRSMPLLSALTPALDSCDECVAAGHGWSMTKAQCGRYANKVCPPLSQQQHTIREQLYASEELPVPGLTATEVGQPEENKLSAVTAPPDVPKIDGHRTVDLADVKSLYVATRLIDQGRNEEASDVLKLLLYDDEHLSSIIGGNHTGSSQNVFTVAYALRLLATIAFNREDYVEMETSLELACPLMAYVISTGVSKVGNSTDRRRQQY